MRPCIYKTHLLLFVSALLFGCAASNASSDVALLESPPPGIVQGPPEPPPVMLLDPPSGVPPLISLDTAEAPIIPDPTPTSAPLEPPPRQPSGIKGEAPLAWPVAGSISTYYSGWHLGIDIVSSCGTPIGAATAGAVVYASWFEGYGNFVVVDHGSFQTHYAHLTDFSVALGQQVAQGGTIGSVGNTGYSFGCHLHYEDSRGNPLEFLP